MLLTITLTSTLRSLFKCTSNVNAFVGVLAAIAVGVVAFMQNSVLVNMIVSGQSPHIGGEQCLFSANEVVGKGSSLGH